MERQLQRVLQQGFEYAVSRRQESWVYRKRSGHFLHMSWRAIGEQRSQRLKKNIFPPPGEKLLEPARAGPRMRARKQNRRRGSEGEDGTPRSSRTVSGWLAVCRWGWLANSWRRRAEGAGLWRSLYTPPSMCGDGRRWRQSTGWAGTILETRSNSVGENKLLRSVGARNMLPSSTVGKCIYVCISAY